MSGPLQYHIQWLDVNVLLFQLSQQTFVNRPGCLMVTLRIALQIRPPRLECG